MRKILLINWRDVRNPEAGGAETYYHEIFSRLARSGEYQVTVLSHTFAGSPSCEEIDGTRVIRIGSRSFFNYAVIPFVRRHEGEYDLLIEDINKVPFLTPLYTRIPRLHMVMHFFGASIFREVSAPLASYVYMGEKLVPLFYRREPFIAISDSTKRDIRKFCTDEKRIAVVEPGIDVDFFHPTARKESPPLLVYCGRIKRYKNVQFLINSMVQLSRRIPDITLHVAGSGDYLPVLKRLAQDLGIANRVVFHGRVSEDQKRDLLSRATLFVNPSMREGWGITNIEANLCGTISISSNGAGLRDSVRNGITGLLYRPDDQAEFVDKVARMIEDPSSRETMERAALEQAKAYAWDAMARKMHDAIELLVPRGGVA